MNKEVVTELIQDEFNPEKLKKELIKILDKNEREKIFLEYYNLEKALGGKGASDKTAKLIYKSLKP